MNAPLTKEQIVLLSANTLTQPGKAVQARGTSGLARSVAKGLRWMAEWPRRQATIDELSRLSERELADIGLTRSQVRSVFSRA